MGFMGSNSGGLTGGSGDDESAPRSSHCYVDLVITQDDDGTYRAYGGPDDAIFCGSGISADEAVGSWFRQNREVVGFQTAFVIDGQFQCSTRYGDGRSRDELGPNELKALEEWERENPHK